MFKEKGKFREAFLIFDLRSLSYNSDSSHIPKFEFCLSFKQHLGKTALNKP